MCSWHLNWNRRNIFLDSRIIYHCYDTTLVKSTVSAVCLRIKKLSYCLNKIYIYEMTIHICLTEEFRELISCASVRSWKKAKERENDCLKVVRHGVICFCRADYLYERFWHGTLKKHLVIIREAVRKTLTLSLPPSPPSLAQLAELTLRSNSLKEPLEILLRVWYTSSWHLDRLESKFTASP